MKGVSPITIGLVLLALPILIWLWWTSADDEVPVTAVSRTQTTAGNATDGSGSAPRELPPIETFSAMIDQPLFAATRRPLGLDSVNDLPVTEDSELPPPPADDIGDRYRLIGTILEGGRVTALLAGSNGSFVRVRRGDRVENWTVGAINRQRVLMVNGESATELALDPDARR